MRCPVHASRRKHHSATRSLARCLLARPPYPIPPCTESVPTPLSNHNMVRRMVGSRLHASTRVYPAPGGADSNCLDPDLAAPTGDGRPHAGATSGEATSRYILAASLSAHAGGELSRSLLGSFCEGQQRGRRRVRAPAYLVRTGKCSTQPNARSLLLVLLAATPQKSPCRPIEEPTRPKTRLSTDLTDLTHTGKSSRARRATAQAPRRAGSEPQDGPSRTLLYPTRAVLAAGRPRPATSAPPWTSGAPVLRSSTTTTAASSTSPLARTRRT
jgi:hypothetical protein